MSGCTHLLLRGFGLLLLLLVQIASHSTVAAGASPDDNIAGNVQACAASPEPQVVATGEQSPCEATSGIAKHKALVQRDSRVASSRASSQIEKKDDTAATGGSLSKAQQAINRRERALLRAQQARRVAQQARERRTRLEAERAERLKARSLSKSSKSHEDNMFNEEGVDVAEQWQHQMAKRRRAKNSKHEKQASWMDKGRQDGSYFNPMVTMVFFLMSVPTGIVVASLGAVMCVSRLNGNNVADGSARRSIWRSKPGIGGPGTAA
mmetsp:Transcript_22883/g.41495  ORF Transcript_22883/g.41495 Transcript_22883/m.41495 type:complete len:265 (+) Transcript_22883:99-893(+)